VFAVAPSVTFERFAEAINRAFGRWDFSHLHAFELADGRRIGFPDEDFGEDDWIDHAKAKLGSTLEPGERFEFVFDFGDPAREPPRRRWQPAALTVSLPPRPPAAATAPPDCPRRPRTSRTPRIPSG
jgi:hypothetical protein